MTDIELAVSGLSDNWEFVTWTCPYGTFFPTRIIKCKEQNKLGPPNFYNYKVQRKYWFIGWVTLAWFSTDGQVGG